MSHPLDFVTPGGHTLVFAGNPLDRAEDRREESDWLDARFAAPESQIVAIHESAVLVSEHPPHSPYPLTAEARAALSGAEPRIFLGSDNKSAWFAVDVTDTLDSERLEGLNPGGCVMGLRPVAMAAGTSDRNDGGPAILAEGKAMLDWHRRHRFCACCGGQTESRLGGFLRSCRTESCGADHFPRTDPVVIMLVIDGDDILLGRQSSFLPDVYSALAGFMEPGESIEEAVRREVFEEAGIRIGAVRYFASQPWPFPSSLIIGCFAEALTREIVIDGRELEDARWISRADAVAALRHESKELRLPSPMAIAHQLVKHWIEETGFDA